MREYGLRGWVNTSSSSSNQASTASQSTRTWSRSASIGLSGNRVAAPISSRSPSRRVSTSPSPRLGECSVFPVGSTSATRSAAGT